MKERLNPIWTLRQHISTHEKRVMLIPIHWNLGDIFMHLYGNCGERCWFISRNAQYKDVKRRTIEILQFPILLNSNFCSPLGPRIAIIVPCFTYPLTSFKIGLPPNLADMSLNVRLNFSPDCKFLKEIFITLLLSLIIRYYVL